MSRHLIDGERFLRQARLSAPHPRPVLPVAAPAAHTTTSAQRGH
ncbi:hypothetical protein ACF09K_34025 [Streptomyces sp. NPDC014882]